MARVMAALDGEPVPAEHVADDHEALLAVLGYVYARLLVSCVDDRLLTNRYATAEARRLGEWLASDGDDVLFQVAGELGLELDHREADEVYAVPFPGYLTASRELNALEWKLVNRTMEAGQVLLERGAVARLVQDAWRLELADELPLKLPRQVREDLEKAVAEVQGKLADLKEGRQRLDFDEVEPDAFPPCINSIIARIKAGENMSHEGRFAVVSFLHTVGMGREAIIDELFPNVPDFARDITEYQVDHITGRKGKDAYTPPACSSLQTYGLCPMLSRAKEDWDDWCAHDKMSHPLTYYRWGLFKIEKRKERAEARGGGEAEESGEAVEAETDEAGQDEDGGGNEAPASHP